jgi:1-acyl-sn-glycerol-3-phosphate acyltransferase
MADPFAIAATPWSQSLRWATKSIVWLYLRVVHGFQEIGLEHVPPHGPFLAISNHASLLDPAVLLAGFPGTRGFIPAKLSLFQIPIIGGILIACGALPVRRDKSDLDTARVLLRSLRRGIPVAITAEGTRSRTGELQTFLPQVGKLALRANVPVLPLAIIGSFAALPPGAKVPRPKPVAIVFGPAFDPRAAVAQIPAEMQGERLAEIMHQQVAELIARGQPRPSRAS